MKKLFGPISILAALLCLIVSVAVAAGAYLIGHSLHPVYQSSGTIRVAVPSQGGIGDPQVTASNDLATQYAQLVGSAPVEALTAKSLSVTPSSLDGKLSGGTVAAQNLVQVSATASSKAVAQQRATAAVRATQVYLTGITRLQGAEYTAALRRGILADQLPGWISKGLPSGRKGLSASQLANAVAGQRAQTLTQGVRDAAGNEPTFQVVDTATGASQTSPKPSLYALVAFVVALLITLRIAFVLSRPDPWVPPADWNSTGPTRSFSNAPDGEVATHTPH